MHLAVWASVQSVTDCISLDSEGLAKGQNTDFE